MALSAVAAGGPAVPGTVAAAQNAVLNLINGDPVLASALAANPLPTTGGVGFQAMPVGDDSPAALTAASQFGASLHQIGTVFNAVVNLELGGDPNHLTAIQTGLMNMLSFPTATSALAAIEANESPADAAATTAHLQTVLALQIQHDNRHRGHALCRDPREHPRDHRHDPRRSGARWRRRWPARQRARRAKRRAAAWCRRALLAAPCLIGRLALRA